MATKRREARLDGFSGNDIACARLIMKAGFPTRHMVNVRGNKLDERQESTVDWCQRNSGTGYTVILCGPPGVGKTHSAVLIGVNRIVGLGQSVVFTTAATMMAMIRSGYGKESETTETDMVKRYTSPDLLVIDEAHDMPPTDFSGRMLREIIDSRYREFKDTIIINNWTREDVSGHIPPQIISRANERGGVVACDGWKDRRVRNAGD